MRARVATPWGKATVVEEVSVPQEAGDRAFASLVQLLEGDDGSQLVRFAYSTGGSARRGPVTLRAEDIEALARDLSQSGQLRRLLRKALGR